MTAYAYRDPARVTPARLAELQARDARAAVLARPRASTSPDPAARQARIRQFARLRARRYTVADAGKAMGIHPRTARHYETARKLLTGSDA